MIQSLCLALTQPGPGYLRGGLPGGELWEEGQERVVARIQAYGSSTVGDKTGSQAAAGLGRNALLYVTIETYHYRNINWGRPGWERVKGSPEPCGKGAGRGGRQQGKGQGRFPFPFIVSQLEQVEL